MDAITLCEIITVADYLQVEPLVRCASNALGHDIMNTSPGALHLMMNRVHDVPKVFLFITVELKCLVFIGKQIAYIYFVMLTNLSDAGNPVFG